MLCCNILPTSSLTAPLEREKWQMLLWLCEQGDGMHSFYLLQTEKLYIMAWKGEIKHLGAHWYSVFMISAFLKSLVIIVLLYSPWNQLLKVDVEKVKLRDL